MPDESIAHIAELERARTAQISMHRSATIHKLPAQFVRNKSWSSANQRAILEHGPASRHLGLSVIAVIWVRGNDFVSLVFVRSLVGADINIRVLEWGMTHLDIYANFPAPMLPRAYPT